MRTGPRIFDRLYEKNQGTAPIKRGTGPQTLLERQGLFIRQHFRDRTRLSLHESVDQCLSFEPHMLVKQYGDDDGLSFYLSLLLPRRKSSRSLLKQCETKICQVQSTGHTFQL